MLHLRVISNPGSPESLALPRSEIPTAEYREGDNQHCPELPSLDPWISSEPMSCGRLAADVRLDLC